MILAGLATPLVLSVLIVSFDFAVSQLPGWHTTIFPPYFVARAIFSGFAMVLTLMVVCRTALDGTCTDSPALRSIGVLVTGSLVGYAYAMEFFVAWYSGNYEQFAFVNRAFGQYAGLLDYGILQCDLTTDLLVQEDAHEYDRHLHRIDFREYRNVVRALRDYRNFFGKRLFAIELGVYSPTAFDIATFLGSFGLFFTLFCLFVRYVPMVAIAEVKLFFEHYHAPEVESASTAAEA